MKAKIEPNYNMKRQKLADIVPLDAPFTIYLSPTQACNFKCSYCTHGLSKEEKEQMNFKQVHMSDELFDKVVEQAKEFDGKIKRIVFVGMGEPLANPKIPEMIGKLSEAGVTSVYELVTNGYLLSHEMTDRLLENGLTYLRVSIQGLTAKKYKEITGVDIDYAQLIDNIRYFYENKGDCKVYIKIINECLEEGETQEDFFSIFGDICDQIYVEHLVNAQPSMVGKYGDDMNRRMTLYGEKAELREVCPYMFYSLQIDAIGNIFPCVFLGLSEDFSLGNVAQMSLIEAWFSDKRYNFCKMLLTGKRNQIPQCANCENYMCMTPKEDNLDNHKEIILKRLEEKKNGRN